MAQLKLFHPDCFDGIEIVDARADPTSMWYGPRYGLTVGMSPCWHWKCGRCGKGGAHYGWKRPDLLEWARKNHKCARVETDYVKTPAVNLTPMKGTE